MAIEDGTTPPSAPQRPHRSTWHGQTLEDPWHWLKDPGYPEVSDPEILAYLQAENRHFDAWMAPHRKLVDELFNEIKGRQPEDDASVPHRQDGYWYRWRFEAGAQYRIWERAPDRLTEAELAADPQRWEVFLDEPALAAGSDYFRLGGLAVSPDGRRLAYSADNNGSERYRLTLVDVGSGELLDEAIEATLGSPVWDNASRGFFYKVVNEQWRPWQVRYHRLGTPVAEDPVVFEEADESFFVDIGQTQSDAWILISAADHVTSETWLIPADAPETAPRLVQPRRPGREYHLDHREGWFYALDNGEHKNNALKRFREDQLDGPWETLIEGCDRHYLTDLLCLKDWVVLEERIDGLDQVRVLADGEVGAEAHYIAFPEATYSAGLGTNSEYDTATLRLGYNSLVTPGTVYDYDLRERGLTVRKVQQIPSGYDASRYRSERLMATARDGVQVPVSLVYRADRPRSGPLYLYGYGAYGLATAPGFSAGRLSLLDRGFAFAIAHVRGGDDLGYHWYEAGKLERRNNTFNDFVDVARFLIEDGRTEAGRIAIMGGSAGGELMGAVVNQAPELWGAVAAHVPFMDVLNTMLDTSLPLTPIEWPEWGNPIESRDAFELIRSYSPYDQLAPGAYPPMLVTAGLNDPRVTYWEPAKYVAKLRTLKRDGNPLLLKTNMGAGHGGKSGRYDAIEEAAEEYAFVLVSLGLAN